MSDFLRERHVGLARLLSGYKVFAAKSDDLHLMVELPTYTFYINNYT